MNVIPYTARESKRVRDLMDDAITAELLKEMGVSSLRDLQDSQRQTFAVQHFQRMKARGF